MRGLKYVLLVACRRAVRCRRLRSAQGTLTGTVRDASGAVLPGVTVEAAQPRSSEKVRTVVTDGAGHVPHHRAASRHLQPDVLAARLQQRQARRHRAGRVGGPHDSRRDARRRASRKRSRSPARRRSSTCRACAARPCSTADIIAADSGDAHGRLAAQRHARPDRRQQRPAADADDDVLQRARRPDQRRPHDGQRHDGRGGVQRRRRVVLHPRHGERRRGRR